MGRLEITQGDCEGALWAQLADEAPPVSAAAEPADAVLTSLALTAVRASSAYLDTQKDYDTFRDELAADPDESTADEGPLPASWEDYQPSPITVQLLAHPGGETYVVTALQAGEGCGRFGAEVVQLWQLRDGALEEIPASLELGNLPVAAVDLDEIGRAHV